MDDVAVRLPAELTAAVNATVAEWTSGGKVERLWARDAALWTGADEAVWLGWLDVVDHQLAGLDGLRRVAEEIRGAGFAHALVLGMGGSSLCPDVLRATFGKITGHPELLVLDSTDPAQIRAVERRLDVARTIFIVSSKSGSTLEPNIFKQYFFDRVKRADTGDRAGDHFVAITDPGSRLERVAATDRFRHVAYGVPSIGGRYSALSSFGMVPAAVMGLDVAALLGHAAEMARRCSAPGPAASNPGAALGIVLGVLARHGRDKVTLVTSPDVGALGAWLEQLLAESTGKLGKGLIPIDRERLGPPAGRGLPPRGRAAGNPRGPPPPPGARKGHAGPAARGGRARRVARAAPGGAPRQARKRIDPDRPRAARPAGGLRQRPPLRLRAPRLRARPLAGRGRVGARACRPTGRADHPSGLRASRRRVLPLGARDRGGRRRARRQRLRPARRRGEQGGDARADRSIREGGHLTGGGARAPRPARH